MGKFPKFEKETKEGNIRRIISKLKERLERVHAKCCCEAEIEELIKVMEKLLTDTVVEDLLEITNFGKLLEKGQGAEYFGFEDKFWKFDDKISDYERFLKSFYYDILPTVILDCPNFDTVRADFLRYFILFDNFAVKRREDFHKQEYVLEAFNSDPLEKIKNFSNIPELYKFAASEIDFLCWEKSDDSLYNEAYNTKTLCFYNVFKSLFNDCDFFEATFNALAPKALLGFIHIFDRDYLYNLHEIMECPEKFEFYVFEPGVRPKLAEIMFSNEKMKNYLACGDVFESMECSYENKIFFSAIIKFDSEYQMPVVKHIAEREIKKIGDLEYAVYFASDVANAAVTRCEWACKPENIKSHEAKQLILEIFLREKIVGKEWFKNLPELFQQIVIVEQARSIFKKAEIVVVPDLSETDIDKEKLKKDVDKFLADLSKIARNGGKPSDYYAGEPVEIQGVADPKSYLTTLIFDSAVAFLRDSFGTWKAAKPMLAIFRNLKEQAYSIDMEHYEYDSYTWAFVPLRITPLLGSLEGEEAANVCEEWFKHLAGQLKSADDFAINKRKENPEDVPDEFKKGYDITIIEPHPLWREAFCEAAGDLRVNSGCKSVFNHLKKNDIDKDVREAAAKTLERIEKIKGKFDSGSRKRALLNAWWWYRVAHLKSLGIDFDWVSAQNLKSKEVKINYPKNY